MTRRTMILATGGAIAAIAVVGTAIGAGAAELVAGGTRVTPVSAIAQATENPGTPPASAPAGVPTAAPTDVPTGNPTGTPTSAPPGTSGIGHDRAVEIALAEAGGGRRPGRRDRAGHRARPPGLERRDHQRRHRGRGRRGRRDRRDRQGRARARRQGRPGRSRRPGRQARPRRRLIE